MSGALVCTSQYVQSVFPDDELMIAWKTVGEQHFNKCHKCGKWVIDAMYNAEVLECVECAPYEEEPMYCKHCGIKIEKISNKCPECGMPFLYEGGVGQDA